MKETNLTSSIKETRISTINCKFYEDVLNKALNIYGYKAHATIGGSIEIYELRARRALKNLKVAVFASNDMDFGLDEEIRRELEQRIIKAILDNPYKE